MVHSSFCWSGKRCFSIFAFIGFLIMTGAGEAHAGLLQNQLVPGGIYRNKVELGTKVFYKGEEIKVSKKGEFILGFGRDAALKQTYRTVDAKGVSRDIHVTLNPRDYKIQRINGIAKKFIQPAKAVLERIRMENSLVKKARLQTSDYNDFFKGFSWPLKGPITGVFGSQRFFNGEPRRPHFGVDIMFQDWGQSTLKN